jgi:hypothetical protein
MQAGEIFTATGLANSKLYLWGGFEQHISSFRVCRDILELNGSTKCTNVITSKDGMNIYNGVFVE